MRCDRCSMPMLIIDDDGRRWAGCPRCGHTETRPALIPPWHHPDHQSTCRAAR